MQNVVQQAENVSETGRFVYNLYPAQTGDYRLHFELLDGDYDKVLITDFSIDLGISPPQYAQTFRCGRRVHTEFLPTRLQPNRKKGRLPDYCNVQLAQICSQEFRNLVEAHDPGAHQYEPVQIVWKDGSVDPTTYYWFIPGNRKIALDPEQTNPPLHEITQLYLGGTTMGEGRARPGPVEAVVMSRVIVDCDIFVLPQFPGGSRIYMSEKMKMAFESAKLTGIGAGDPMRLV